jgi:hypothetical protein
VRSMYLPLPTEAHEALVRLAEQKYRHPKDQAVVLLLDSLRQRGLLPAEPAAPVTVAPQESGPDGR